MATYDPRQSLAQNLALSGLGSDGGLSMGSLDPSFISAIQTAFARSGAQDYGGQGAFGLISNADRSRAQADPLGYANELLASQGIQGFANSQELSAANTALPGHQGSQGLGGMFSHLGDTASGLLSNPGFRALALTAAGGAAMGGGGAGSAAAGGTAGGGAGNAAILGMGTPATAETIAAHQSLLSQLGAAGGGALGGAAGASGTTPAGTGLNPAMAGPQWGAAAAVPAATAPAAAGAASGIGSFLTSPVAMGIGAGALLGGLGGSQQAGSITVEEGIPDWLQPYVKPALDKYSTDLQNYQIDPYGVMPSAMKEFQNTISGMYLDPSTNKYLEDYFRLGSERVKGSLSPSFGHMQAFGQHSGYNEALSRGLGDLAVGLYGGAYEKERDRQSQMTAVAPSFLGQSSTAAFAPYQQYLQTVGSLGKKKDQPYFDNPFGNVLGGAFLGGSLGGMFK